MNEEWLEMVGLVEQLKKLAEDNNAGYVWLSQLVRDRLGGLAYVGDGGKLRQTERYLEQSEDRVRSQRDEIEKLRAALAESGCEKCRRPIGDDADE